MSHNLEVYMNASLEYYVLCFLNLPICDINQDFLFHKKVPPQSLHLMKSSRI